METPILNATFICADHTDQIERWGTTFNQWDIQLTYKDKQITCDYFTGIGITEEPTVHDVVRALIADDETLQVSDSFESWCYELGYNVDSITDRNTYEACIVNGEKIRELYGDDFAAVSEEVEDL